MKKYGKHIINLIAILCIIAIPVVYNLIYDKNHDEIESNENHNIVENEIALNNVNNNLENQIENSVEISGEETTNTVDYTEYEKDDDVGSTDKKQEAIELVKDFWGEDDTVSFRCDSVKASGEYIIAVISKSSAQVKNYFKVNLETKKVEVHY